MDVVDARSVFHIHIVRDATELERSRAVASRFLFHPEFVHQIFESENIRGYDCPLINLKFAAHSLYLYGPEFVSIRKNPDADDVVGCIKKFLPNQPDFQTHNIALFKKKLTSPFAPLGDIVSTYFIKEKPDGDTVEFQIRKADFSMKGVRKFHERLRFHATCFIESASFIDDTDEKWSLLFLYRRRPPSEGSNSGNFFDIAAYVSMYSFYRHPGGERLRLSQIVVLPPYQRYGHGRHLLQAVYDEGIRRDCFEVTVEDPTRSFQRLRDHVDLRRLLAAGFYRTVISDGGKHPNALFCSSLEKWDARIAFEIRKKLKISLPQIRRVYEMLKLRILHENNVDEAIWTDFRLEVKRRLQKQYLGDSTKSTWRSSTERKKILAALYSELIDDYTMVINRNHEAIDVNR